MTSVWPHCSECGKALTELEVHEVLRVRPHIGIVSPYWVCYNCVRWPGHEKIKQRLMAEFHAARTVRA